MSQEDPNKSAKSLVDSILKKKSLPPSEVSSKTESPASSPGTESTEDIASLIAIYFELEEPEERDEVFDQISNSDSPLVLDFLENMLNADSDAFLRSAAASRLARRGHPGAVALLGEDLDDPQESFFFAQAAHVLGEIIGPPFFDTLKEIWQDPERDPEYRQEAMLAMESIDAVRACQESVSFLQNIHSLVDFPEEEIEAAVLLFARHQFTDAIAQLRRLNQLAQAKTDAPSTKAGIEVFLEEAAQLLSSEPR